MTEITTALISAAGGVLASAMPKIIDYYKKRKRRPFSAALAGLFFGGLALVLQLWFHPRLGPPKTYGIGSTNHADTDGFVMAWIDSETDKNNGLGPSVNMEGRTGIDPSDLSTKMAHTSVPGKLHTGEYGAFQCSVMFPVRKGEYWTVALQGAQGNTPRGVVWIPLLSMASSWQ